MPWVSLVWDSYYFKRTPHDTIICGSFWWRDICKLMDKFRAVTSVTVGKGDSVLIWSDHWEIGESCIVLQERLPRLFSFCLQKNLSVRQVVQAGNLQQMFSLPLSQLAFREFNQLSSLLSENSFNTDCNDNWAWRHGKKAEYSAKKYYEFVHQPVPANPILRWV